jgi:hypothetical protein
MGREMEMQASNSLQYLLISLVTLGIIFGEDRLLAYSFIVTGVVLAIAWSFIARRTRSETESIDKAVRDD